MEINPLQPHTDSVLPLVEHTWIQKTQKEISAMKRGVKVLEHVFKWIQTAELVGKTELKVSMEIAQVMKKHGAEALAFPIIVASGVGAADVHHWPTKRKIAKGDVLMIDCGCVVDGYCTDCTRTYYIGAPSKRFETYYTAVLAAQERALKKLTVGARVKTVDMAARNYLYKHSWGKTFIHSTGHGVGRNIHELPVISHKKDDILLSNSVVTVEPAVYIKNWGGVRIEDMVWVKKSGIDILTKRIPKNLKSMILQA